MGETRQLWIPGTAGKLEATLRTAAAPRAAAVVAHPHPQHGGTMHNAVVFHVDRELNRAGLHTLRFNFRGIGGSDGRHEQGIGEVDDVASAVNWVRGISAGLPLLVVGYSFGSWCGLRHAKRDDRVSGMLALGLPVRHYDFNELANFRRPLAVVQGSRDEFGSVDEIQAALDRTESPGRVWIVAGSPHLFPGKARKVAGFAVDAANWILSEI